MSTISLEKFLFFGSVPAAVDTTRGWRFARASERDTAGLSSHPLRCWETRHCRFPAPSHKGPSPAETAPPLCEAGDFQSFFTHTLSAYFSTAFCLPLAEPGRPKGNQNHPQLAVAPTPGRGTEGPSSHPLRRWESRHCRFPAPSHKGPSPAETAPLLCEAGDFQSFFTHALSAYFSTAFCLPLAEPGKQKAAKNSPRQNRRLCLFCGSQ